MLFNSLAFAVFFVITFVLYWLLRRFYRAQNVLLLAASYFFYGWWDVRFLVLIVISTVLDYLCAWSIQKGSMSLIRRVRASIFLVLMTFISLGVDFRAFDTGIVGRRPVVVVDWGHLLTAKPIYWWAIFGVGLIAVLFNAVYPLLMRLGAAYRRRLLLILSIVANLTVLAFFKYYNFFIETFETLMQSLLGVTGGDWALNIVLPIGISFYIFKAMSYTIDVYRGRMEASESLTEVATYVSFFPELLAGPIERATSFLPQLRKPRVIGVADLREGLWLITWGLFQKTVVADRLSVIVNAAFAPFSKAGSAEAVPEDGIRLLIIVYAFALQIYCDFAGYTDIARGTARLLGFDVMLNFNLPYLARNPSDFWRRWHISLSTWLRDYLYIPLGGNRHGKLPTYRNLMLTMLLGGLWHGAAWTFVLWGGFHGFILVVYRAFSQGTSRWASAWRSVWNGGRFFRNHELVDPQSGRPLESTDEVADEVVRSAWANSGRAVLQIVVMFHLVCLGWLLFRAPSMAVVRIFLHSILLHPHWSREAAEVLRYLVFYSWFFIAFELLRAWKRTLMPLESWPWFARLNVWGFVVMSLLALAVKSGREFIYFAF